MGIAELLPSYILDNPRILIEECYLALPVFGAQIISPGPELMDDLFSFDLSQYVAWYKTWSGGFLVDSVEMAATFFIWMKLKVYFPLPHPMSRSSMLIASSPIPIMIAIFSTSTSRALTHGSLIKLEGLHPTPRPR